MKITLIGYCESQLFFPISDNCLENNHRERSWCEKGSYCPIEYTETISE